MKKYIVLFLKGIAMGVANVIPGVSGGTIALVAGIYEELINALKSIDKKAIKLLLKLDFKSLAQHVNLYFLIAVFGGSIVSVFSVANLFKFLFANYPLHIWAYFFGLILISIYYIGKTIKNWNQSSIISLVLGITVAILFTFISPASENDNLFFVFFCGIVGITGMILPGLSGSFILILLGNYELLLVNSIADFKVAILTVFFIGSVVGVLLFSHVLAWLLKKFKDQTLATLTGFIAGSLVLIWPWKRIAESIIIGGKEKVLKYDIYFPSELSSENLTAFVMIIVGVLSVYLIERYSEKI